MNAVSVCNVCGRCVWGNAQHHEQVTVLPQTAVRACVGGSLFNPPCGGGRL